MPGLHGQLTSTELTNALAACDTLIALAPYLGQMTRITISTLHTDLTTEQEDRHRARTKSRDEARKKLADA